jgi:hypothetical protein
MLHVVLDRRKISKTILEKAFFFILWCFYLFSVFVSKNLKNVFLSGELFFLAIGHMGYQKIKDFVLNSKKQTCLSDKMPPKKLKLKNPFFRFLILTFWGGILSLWQVCIFEISIIS